MFERVVGESHFAVGFLHTSQEKLNPLLLCAARKRSAAHCREHLGAPVVVGDRDHFLHEALLCIVANGFEVPALRLCRAVL